MESRIWDVVLVEWVNCLKISDPINSTVELRNGDFFTNLLKLLTPDRDNHLDTLHVIIKLLKEQYPHYKLKREHNVDLEDLPATDLIAITSLLMYYSCYTDRREILTSPMCHRLSQKTQLCIRTFLEKAHKNVSESELVGIINESVSEKEAFKVQAPWFGVGDSPACDKSPLQDFLNTPCSKSSRVKEKDRELGKLQSQLQLERYEKSDLLEELRQQQDKNKKLDSQLKQKSAELTRLRSEIIALENKTPPHFQNNNSNEIQRRLRMEIENLEQYVAQLQNEQELLQKENEVAKNTVKKLETQLFTCQEKVTTTENSYDCLMEKSQQQELELQALKIHFNELKAMLEELQAEKTSNESVEVYDTTLSESNLQIKDISEDLACSVVEVQLRDVQKENAGLKFVVKETEEKCHKLNEDLGKANSKFVELEKSCKKLKGDNKALMKNLSLLTETQNSLQQTQEQLLKSNLEMKKLDKELKTKIEELKNLNVVLLESQSLNKSLSDDLEKSRVNAKNFEMALKEKDNLYEILQKEAKLISVEHQKILAKYKETSFELESKKNLFKEFDQNVEHHLSKLQKLLLAEGVSRGLDFKDKNAVFEIIFKQAEKEVNDRKELEKKMYTSEKLIDRLQTNILILNEREAISLQEKHQLRDNIKTAENNINNLQNTIINYERKNQELNNTIDNLKCTIEELESLKEVIEEKENNIKILTNINTDLKNECNGLNENLKKQKETEKHLEELISTLEKNNNNIVLGLQNDINNLNRNNNALEKDLNNANEMLTQKKRKEEDLEKIIRNLEELQNSLKQEIETKNAELDKQKDNEIAIQKTVRELSVQNTELGQKLISANENVVTIQKSENELKEIILNNEKVALEKIASLNSENQQYCNEIKVLEDKLQTAIQNNKVIDDEIVRLLKEKEAAENNWKLNSDFLKKNIALLQITITKLETDLKKSHGKNDELNKMLLKVQQNFIKLADEKNLIIEEKDKIQKELNNLIEKLETVEAVCEEKDNILNDVNKEMLVLKLEIENKNHLIDVRDHEIKEKNLELNYSKKEIDRLEGENKENNECIGEMKKEIQILERLKSDLEMDCKKLEKTTEEMLKKISVKNNELNNLVVKLKSNKKSMQLEIQSLQSAQTQNDKLIQKLSEERNALTSHHDNKIETLNTLISELTHNIELINERENNYIHEINILKDELSDTIRKYTDILQEQHEIKIENETQIANLTENLHNLVSNYNELDKKHKDTLTELEEIKSDYKILQGEKAKLEMQILEQKAQLEMTYQSENNKLMEKVKISINNETSLKRQLDELNEKLSKSTHNGVSLREEIKVLKEVVNKINDEKNDLLQKNDKLEKDYADVQVRLNSMHIEHEKFVSESESKLFKLTSQSTEEIKNLVEEKHKIQENLETITCKLTQLEDDKIKLIECNKQACEEKNEKIKILENSVKEYESKISVLIVEQQQLESRISFEKLQQEKMQESLTDFEKVRLKYETSITKLKCANEILETGKTNLENENFRLKTAVTKLEASLKFDSKKFDKALLEKEYELMELKKEKIFFEEELGKKNKSIAEAEYNIEMMGKAMRHLQMQAEAFNKEKLQMEYSVDDQKNMISKLQCDFEFINEEMDGLKLEKENLKREIEKLQESEGKLQKEIMESNNKMSVIIQQNEKLESELQSKLVDISDLNMRIGVYLEDVSKLNGEKQKYEHIVSSLKADLEKITKNRDEIRDSQAKMIKETENNILRAHENAIEVKNDLLKRIEQAEIDKSKQVELKNEIEMLLAEEKHSKETLEMRVLELTNEKSKFMQLAALLQNSVNKLKYIVEEKPVENAYNTELDLNSLENLVETISDVETKIVAIFEKRRNLTEVIEKLENEKLETVIRIDQLQSEKEKLNEEKEKLINDYNLLVEEKSILSTQKQKQDKSFEELRFKRDMLQAKCDQMTEYNADKDELKEKAEVFRTKHEKIEREFKNLGAFMSSYKNKVGNIMSVRKSLVSTFNNIKQNLHSVQRNVKEDSIYKNALERKESFEIIADDIYRQINITTKFVYDLLQHMLQIYEQSVGNILNGKETSYENKFNDFNVKEELEKVEDLKDTSSDLLEKLKILNTEVENIKQEKQPLKENHAHISSRSNVISSQDDDLKKKNLLLKQRLTLADSARSNLERKIKQLREENKKLVEQQNQKQSALDGDEHYKILLAQHIETQKEHEQTLRKCEERYKTLHDEYETFKANCAKNDRSGTELRGIREAYSNLMGDNTKIKIENDSLRKKLDNRGGQINELLLVKEAYEKLLEENNKLSMELDTVKYKRNRDKDEFVRLLKKEKDDGERNENRRTQEIRNEYEMKLEKMKEKMMKLYKEEVDKEMKKKDNVYLLRVIEQLKDNLKDAKLKVHEIEIERDRALDILKGQQRMEERRNPFGSHESLSSISSHINRFRVAERESLQAAAATSFSLPRGVRPSQANMRNFTEDRKTLTLPKAMDLNTARAGIGEMEDEEDSFNNKYLADLKEGRCQLPNEDDPNARFSELTWRNSLCPPHLKSSYMTEFQFISPSRFKEDEIKFGNNNLDNSSTKLLPNEKPRTKKDIGTTSYKRPGPPTPSKNGGRVSLQGNEIHLRDVTESKTPKRVTPSRLKALFMGRNTSVKDNSENQSTTPKGRRLSIFRKPR